MTFRERVAEIASRIVPDLSAEETVIRFCHSARCNMREVEELPILDNGEICQGMNGKFCGVVVATPECLTAAGYDGEVEYWRVLFHELAHYTGIIMAGREPMYGGMEEMLAEMTASILNTVFGMAGGSVEEHFKMYKQQMNREGTLTHENMAHINAVAEETALMIITGQLNEEEDW